MRLLLAFTLLLFACDKLSVEGMDDAGTAGINPELEQEAQELNKLGVEHDMLESKVEITAALLEEAQEQLAEAKSAEQKAAAIAQRDKADKEHKRAKAALLRFQRQTIAP
jgi:FKBP-type peptidyl-prolyl cis-trans isomerase